MLLNQEPWVNFKELIKESWKFRSNWYLRTEGVLFAILKWVLIGCFLNFYLISNALSLEKTFATNY